jgi:hypothetical protein
MVADVTIITAVYGDKYDHFIDGWSEAINNLTIAPKRVICAGDRLRNINAEQIVSQPAVGWKWRSPWYWNSAARNTDTEWIWVLDIDDRIKPNALENLMEQTCDIWLVGIDVNGTENYLPPRLTNEQIASSEHCYFCCGSPIRRSWWQQNPYRDLAFTDWAMWRTSAKMGARFEWANKVGYYYRKDFDNSMSGWADADVNNRAEILAL